MKSGKIYLMNAGLNSSDAISGLLIRVVFRLQREVVAFALVGGIIF